MDKKGCIVFPKPRQRRTSSMAILDEWGKFSFTPKDEALLPKPRRILVVCHNIQTLSAIRREIGLRTTQCVEMPRGGGVARIDALAADGEHLVFTLTTRFDRMLFRARDRDGQELRGMRHDQQTTDSALEAVMRDGGAK